MNAVINRLEHVRWAIVNLHRIGHHELATWLKHTGRFLDDLAAVIGMQDSILRPDHVELGILKRNGCKVTIHDLNEVSAPLLLVHIVVTFVLNF
jgi:hypothetical protein